MRMMQTDLISRDVVLSVGNVRKVTEYDEAGFGMTYHAVPVEVIKKIEAIDAVPVVHARWIGFPNGIVWGLKCDACYRIIPMGQTPETMHYCPQCGARMDAKENT